MKDPITGYDHLFAFLKSSQLVQVDLATRKPVGTHPTKVYWDREMVPDQQADKLYVASNGHGARLAVFDLKQRKLTELTEIPGDSGEVDRISMGPDGELYLGLRWSKPRLGRYDPKVGKFEDLGMIEKGLDGLAIDPAGNFYCKSGRRMVQYRRTK